MMQVHNQALKEWSVVIRALEEGKQCILLRKGGILDEGFNIKDTKFLLFPTYEHQHKRFVREEFSYLFKEEDKEDEIRLTSAASVVRAYDTFDKDKLLKLADYYIYNEDFIDYRLTTYPHRPVKVILVNVYPLEEPIILKKSVEYAGCKSWVPINLECKTSSKPIIPYDTLSKIDKKIEEIMR